MDSAFLLRQLRADLAAFRACLDRDLGAPVEHCGDWTLRDLAAHLGGGNLWAAAAVTEGHGDHEPAPGPSDPDALRTWFEDTSEALLKVLDTDPAAPAWTFHPPHTVGFWQRRRVQETAVHLWDAGNALGAARPIDPVVAADGVAEVFDTMAPRQIARGRAAAPERALRLSAADLGESWTYGPGTPAATVTATAEELMLMLWGRMDAAGPRFAWTGEREFGLAVLAGPLTP